MVLGDGTLTPDPHDPAQPPFAFGEESPAGIIVAGAYFVRKKKMEKLSHPIVEQSGDDAWTVLAQRRR